jgi:hypothetical protein
MRDVLGTAVEEVNLAWELSNPHPAQVADPVEYVRTDQDAREALTGSDAVLIFASQNDLAYNPFDDPCAAAPHYPRIHWGEITEKCIDATVRDYAQHLGALLDEIDQLRGDQPTMLRIVTAINTTTGDLVDPTWNSPAAVEPSVYNVAEMAAVQCRLARQHQGHCADALHAFNGKDGRQSAQPYLGPVDAIHLS